MTKIEPPDIFNLAIKMILSLISDGKITSVINKTSPLIPRIVSLKWENNI